jgi:hypothetical protein
MTGQMRAMGWGIQEGATTVLSTVELRGEESKGGGD